MKHKTKITFENEHGTHSVSICDSEVTMAGVYEQLFVPLMVSVGYPYELVIEHLDNLDIARVKDEKPYIRVGVKEVDFEIASYLVHLHDHCPLDVQSGVRSVQDWLLEEAEELRSKHGIEFILDKEIGYECKDME